MSAYNINDVVVLRKGDIKDKTKKDKIIQLVKYSFQEVSLFDKYKELILSGKKTIA